MLQAQKMKGCGNSELGQGLSQGKKGVTFFIFTLSEKPQPLRYSQDESQGLLFLMIAL